MTKIYPEFGDIDDPLDTPEIIGVEMCPTFYGCAAILLVMSAVLICGLTVGLWALAALLAR